jgi:hypothetical protein
MSYSGAGPWGSSFFFNQTDTLTTRLLPAFPVASLADLPTPVAGVITLPDSTCWQFEGIVNITPNRLELGAGACILGTVPGRSQIITNNAGPLVSNNTALGGRAVEDVGLDNAGGECLNFFGPLLVPGQGVTSLLIDTVVCENSTASLVSTVGTLEGISAIFHQSLLCSNMVDGWTIRGVNGYVQVEKFVALVHPANFTGITIPASFNAQELLINRSTIVLDNNNDIGLDIASAATVNRALVATCQFPATVPPLAGFGALATGVGKVTPSDLRWKFSANQGIRDSSVGGDMRYVGNVQQSLGVPAAIGSWMRIQGGVIAFVASDLERFTFNGTDLMTYVGEDPANIVLTASLSAEIGGGGNILGGITCFKNDLSTGGTPIVYGTTVTADGHEMRSELNSVQARIVQSSMRFINVRNGDTFRMAARNVTDLTDIEAIGAALTIGVG